MNETCAEKIDLSHELCFLHEFIITWPPGDFKVQEVGVS